MTKNNTQHPQATLPLAGNEVIHAVDAALADVSLTPANIIAGALARANHTGVQAISTVTGLQTALDAKALDADVVHDTGAETIAGVKTFSSAPVVPDASWSIADTNGLQTAIDAKAADSAVVKLTGAQTIAGIKTFSSSPIVPTPTTAGQAAPMGYVDSVIDLASSAGAVNVGTPGGVDDTALVNTARAAAGAGGTVIFSAGTYVVTGLQASVSNQHWIIRPGATVKTKNASNLPTIDVTANGVTIDGGGTLDGNRANQSDATTGLTSAVRIVSRSNVTVRNLTIRDSLSHAVYVDACTAITIAGNRISGTTPTGNHKQILVYDIVGSSVDIEITGNRLDSTAIINGCIAITSWTAGRSIRKVRISGNYCKVGDGGATATLGIELFTSGTATISDATVSDNIVEGPAGVISTDQLYGVSIGGTASSAGYGVINCAVTGNVVRNCPYASIEVVGTAVAVAGNTCIASGALSVSALATTGGLYGVTVTGNSLLDSVDLAYAIHLHGGTHGLYGCVVSGNVIRNSAAASAIYSEGVVFGATITANTITDSGGMAVNLLGTFTDGAIANNVFDLTGVGGTIDAILIGSTSVARVAIHSNVIKGASRNGIYGLVATSDIDVTNNRITHCNNGLKADAVATRWTVVGNTISNSVDRGLIFVVAGVNLAIASNSIHTNPGGNYYTVGSTFLTHVINGAGG